MGLNPHYFGYRVNRREADDDGLAVVGGEDIKALENLKGIISIRREFRNGIMEVLCYEKGLCRPTFRLVNGRNLNEYRLQRPDDWRKGNIPNDVDRFVASFHRLIDQGKG